MPASVDYGPGSGWYRLYQVLGGVALGGFAVAAIIAAWTENVGHLGGEASPGIGGAVKMLIFVVPRAAFSAKTNAGSLTTILARVYIWVLVFTAVTTALSIAAALKAGRLRSESLPYEPKHLKG